MSTGSRSGRRPDPELTFSDQELFDLAVAWLTLSLAFALWRTPLRAVDVVTLARPVGLSLVTVGVAFLLHELAHKVVAVEYGQVAEFRADYQMLFLALMSALAGFLFAAPGAVYHRGQITQRENAMIALAGPVTNLLLAVLFFPLVLLPAPIETIGQMGIGINLFLAAFNMIPFGPLDGRAVFKWHKGIFALVFVPSILTAGYMVLFVGLF
ncbi:zinc metalloprotease [Halopiger thermotolerans]